MSMEGDGFCEACQPKVVALKKKLIEQLLAVIRSMRSGTMEEFERNLNALRESLS